MKRRIYICFPILFLIILLISLPGLQSQILVNQFIKKITSNEGLSHNIVNDIVQDNNGFIWIATQDGLNRFDGYEFKTYQFNPADSASISGNYIESLYFDHKNNLWISTRYGLNLYNPLLDDFSRFQLNTNIELDITKVTASQDGNLWISSYGGGFHYFNVEKKSSSNFNTSNTSLSSDFILTIHEDKHGLLWIGTDNNGVLIFKKTRGKPILHDELNRRLLNFNLTRVEVIFEDKNSNIWIGSREGLVFYNYSLKEFFFIQKSGNPNGLSDNIILDINQDYEGNILIGTQEGGLHILSPDQLKANKPGKFIFSKILSGSEDYNLSYRSVQSIYEDRNRNLWLGTFGNGLNMIPSIQPKFRLLKHASGNPQTINFDKIWGICEDNDGYLWIGTDGAGINKYNLRTGTVKYYYSGKGPSDLSDDAILCALCDSKGRLWFGTYAGGLNLYNRRKDNFIHFKAGDKQGLPVNDIRCIFEATDGIIWLGTNGGGLVRLNAANNTFKSIIPDFNDITAYDIRSIAEDKEGGLWLGTYGTGLFYYQPRTGKFRHFAYDRENSGTLKCNIIYALLYDERQNQLWIGGSQDGGLNRLDLNNLTFTVFDNKSGLANGNIHAIEKDGKNRIWMSTNSGISLFEPEKEEFTNFSRFDGVQEKEFSDGSVLKSTTHDIICFGGSGGLNYFYPDKIQKQEDEIPILITELRIFDHIVPVRSLKNIESPLINTILYTKKIELNHRQNNFTIGFSGLHHANPNKINYQYKLEGVDLSWNNLQNLRYVTFRYLKSGEYEFKVRASNEDGIWHDNYKSLHISIKSPPWKSWWAYVLYTLLTGGIILWIYYYNLKEAKIRHSLVMEKKLRAQEHDLHEERIKFFTNISHELRTPLMLLVNPLEDLLTKESPYTPIGRTFSAMHRSANKLLQLINTLLEFRKTETGMLKLMASEGNIVEHIEENCITFKGLTINKNIKLVFETSDTSIIVWFDKGKLEMIMNNLLSNAIKNTNENKKITVRVSKDHKPDPYFTEGKVIVNIADEGIGIPEDQIDKIFDSFFQVRGTNITGGTGIGLALTKRLIELHKGKIAVRSEINKGTTFSVFLPLGKKHFSEDEIMPEKDSANSALINNLSAEDHVTINSLLERISSLSNERKKILIIEDNPDIRNYLKDLLKGLFMFEEAEDGLTGLDLARTVHPAIILSDVMMPGMDGVVLCRILKSEFQTSHIPIILITANLTHNVHINSLEVGADAYLTKPFKPDVLISCIYNLIKSREKLQDYYLKKFQGGFKEKYSSLSKDEDFLMQVNKRIHNNLDNLSFSIELLHEDLGMSRTVFYHKIKSLTNLSPLELIRHIRLKRAGDLLLTGDYKIYEVMYQVGFSDEKHFRQLFKKHFGVTPSDYMKTGK